MCVCMLMRLVVVVVGCCLRGARGETECKHSVSNEIMPEI